MPMFYTPKPRQFHYKPRFYDPEKERWEAIRQRHADEQAAQARATGNGAQASTANEDDLAYFQRRVRELEGRERHSQGGLTWKDLFRKREMPTFNYQPRFSDTQESNGETHAAAFKKRSVKIKRRYDIGDTDYMKPVPAGRIMLYALVVCLLLYWIIF